MENIKQLTKTLGLNNNQASTYLSLLQLGKATASEIAKHSGITRTTVYDNLLALQNFNLLSTTSIDGKTYFVAESPDSLKELAHKRMEETTDLIQELQKVFNSQASKPSIKIYDPEQGFLKKHELSLIGNRGLRTRLIGDITTTLSYKGKEYTQNYIKERVKIGIRNQVITTENVLEMKDMYSYEKNRQNLREIKYNSALQNLKTQLFGYDDTVWILPTSKQGYAIMINNPEFAGTFNSIFDALWMCSKEVVS